MLLNRYERMIAKRYLFPGRAESVILLVASLSVAAVALGVAALLTVTSVANGFRDELFDKLVSMNGDAVVQGYDGQLEDWQKVAAKARALGATATRPIVEQPLMITANKRVAGVIVRGMRTNDLVGSSAFAGRVLSGSLASLKASERHVALGSRLAEQLGVKVGDQVKIVNPEGRTTVMGTLPRVVSYTITAVFEIGIYDYDKAYVLMPIEDAQDLLLYGNKVTLVELDNGDPDAIGSLALPLQRQVRASGVVLTWRQLNGQLLDLLDTTRTVIFIILSMIILIAVFNILSSLTMLVESKGRDIAILRTMGAARTAIMRIFVAVGVSLGALGTLLGFLIGATILYVRQSIINLIDTVTGQNIWDPSIRFVTTLPARVSLFDVVLISSITMSFSLFATLYPALKAAREDPVQVLRYE